MLKTVSKAIRAGTAPFQRGAFFAPLTADPAFPDCLLGRKKTMPVPVAWFFLSNQILFKGGPQIETEKQTADPCPGRQKAQSQVLPCEGRLLCIPEFYNVSDGHAAGLCLGCMDEGHRDHEGRLQPDRAHLHRGCYRHRFGGPADDELLPLRPHGG